MLDKQRVSEQKTEPSSKQGVGEPSYCEEKSSNNDEDKIISTSKVKEEEAMDIVAEKDFSGSDPPDIISSGCCSASSTVVHTDKKPTKNKDKRHSAVKGPSLPTEAFIKHAKKKKVMFLWLFLSINFKFQKSVWNILSYVCLIKEIFKECKIFFKKITFFYT